jgi:hypothetical protein
MQFQTFFYTWYNKSKSIFYLVLSNKDIGRFKE